MLHREYVFIDAALKPVSLNIGELFFTAFRCLNMNYSIKNK